MNKEIFTARYDPRTDRIEGCTPYTFVWHHENRHRQQFKEYTISSADYTITVISTVAKAILLIGFFLGMADINIFIIAAKLAAFLFIPSVAFNMGLEIDANMYAWRKTR